ncbi:hypothetical protein HMPREF1531_00791 [Propionibacterium sp. oral taxon 192 str. F0372]|uniref:hypothetical protein n=1 Tax=Propionibacterium sp. oral taxon 192 TaxID=671222 RepID=UPI0003541C6F|nr:hypothetical protein [Propionibacterium sp. oral taxon 192]EPH06142.1 hypothetical protein HMPREF1531_00791 [Propionibacterium sp. oral taxon 192 str. F0372]
MDDATGMDSASNQCGIIARHTDQVIPASDPPCAITTAGNGLVAAVDGPVLVLHRPNTGTEEIPLADPSYQTGAAVFSPDGALLHILDQRTEPGPGP